MAAGTIRVYNQAAFEALVVPSNATSRQNSTMLRGSMEFTGGSQSGSPKRPKVKVASQDSPQGGRRKSVLEASMSTISPAVGGESPKRAILRARHNALMSKRFEEISRQVEASKELARERKNQQFLELAAKLEEGKAMEQEIDRAMSVHDAERAQRQRDLYQQWQQNVFEQINKATDDMLAQTTPALRNTMRRQQYQDYLDTVNKGFVFTNIVSDAYDPTKTQWKTARIPKLHDPTLRTVQSKLEEDQLILPLPTKPELAAAHPSSFDLGLSNAARAKSADSTLRTAGAAVTASDGTPNLHRDRVPIVAGSKLGRTGGRWTMPVPWWGTGKLESTSYAYSVTRKENPNGQPIDCHQIQAEAEQRRTKMFGDAYTRVSRAEASKLLEAELPRPTKRTFQPKNTGNLLGSA